MRTIKFRGQRVDNKEWVYGYYVVTPNEKHRIYWKPFEDASSNTWHEVIPSTVGQFTGLLDKNKKECYDGDYDADGNMIGWCDSCHGWQFHLIDVPTKDIICCHNCDGNFMLDDHIQDFEITGTIHD